ncbi:MAG: hypothetical protein EOP06_07010 [Proteobacteria bacterium]|nr:MAG: hypothetical protein EOP06_07010 [Pseudomonadota bacterium]
MFKTLATFVLVMVGAVTAVATPNDATKVHCEALDPHAGVSVFDFYLKLTGHPMSGIFAFSGMFDAQGESLPCKPTGGYLQTTGNYPRGTVTYTAISSCLRNYTYSLKIGTTFYNENEKYDSLLRVVEHGLLGDFPAEETKMICGMVN